MRLLPISRRDVNADAGPAERVPLVHDDEHVGAVVTELARIAGGVTGG